jgi:hypothetical protein
MPRLSDLERDIRTKTNRTVRTVARNIMNDLADAGPVWGGEFRDSWEAYSPATGESISAEYPYSLRDIPELPITKRAMGRATQLLIGNRAPHAGVAMDMEIPAEGFRYPGYGPEGEVVFRGTRPVGGLRGEIGTRTKGGSDNRSTAPLDWLPTYVNGGKMQKALERGIKIEFSR